jgi:hypothetical protein
MDRTLEVLDLLDDGFSEVEGYRVVVLNVEATMVGVGRVRQEGEEGEEVQIGGRGVERAPGRAARRCTPRSPT